MNLLLLGERIRLERKRNKLTIEQLAEKADISYNFLWEIETGRKAPAFGTLYKIIIALNASADYLLGIEEAKHLKNEDKPARVKVELARIINQLISFNYKELKLTSKLIKDLSEYFKQTY
jgi:transcriptional regulator with XRE-family HTH domain